MGPSRARDRFVVTPYRISPGGDLIPDRPTRCAWADDGRPCRVRSKIVRSRKTGPAHPLWVFSCAVHDVFFTVYPPGHLPHGRKAVAAVMPDGTVPQEGAVCACDETPPLLEGTLLDVAWDARNEKTWRSTCRRYDGPSRSTHVRRLDRATQMVGVAADVDPQAQLACASALGVDALRLREGQAMIRNSTGVIGRAQAVVHVLKEVLRVGRNVVDRLVAAACHAGLCGRPFRWWQQTRTLVPLIAT